MRLRASFPGLFCLCLLVALGATAASAATVALDSGKVSGEVLDAGTGLTVYRGIPYVAAPVGDLRWKPPQPVKPWSGVRDATEFGKICPQPGTLAMMSGGDLPASDEDCLFLNVWTTAEAGQKFFDLSTMKVEVKWIVAEGDKVVIRQHATAKAANGNDYENEYVWVYVCREGKIVEIEEHTDSQRFKEIVLS